MVCSENETVEYTVIFKDEHGIEDAFCETKEEALELIEEYGKEKVEQFFKKQWIFDEDIGDWEEGDVEVYEL